MGGYEQEIQSYAADESDVVAEVAIRSPIVKVETPKSVRKLPKSAKKSSTKKADSSIPIEVENPQTVEEDNEEASSNLEAVEEECKTLVTEEISATTESEPVQEVVAEEKTTRGRTRKAAPESVAKKGSKKDTPADESVELIVEAKATRGSKRKANTKSNVEEEPVAEVKNIGNKRTKKSQEDAVVEEVIVEEKTTRGKAKKAAPPPASKRGSKKAAPVVEVEEEEEALVLICDGCENEFFYDELYPKGDFQIPEGDWFCNSCETQKKKTTKCSKTAPEKVSPSQENCGSHERKENYH